ncbi:MAG TPA: porin [Paraburkholderia sp.]|jgi:predicted porin|nr:porin [Paraburkholderia sp.]
MFKSMKFGTPKVLAVVVGAASLSAMTTAHAQSSVTLFGIMDAGVEYLTNAGASKDGSAHSLVREVSGGRTSSRIGFKGNEDLGDGLSAIFWLEGGINIANGTSLQSGRLFGRQAWVGLQSRTFGSVTMGRQRTPLYDYASPLDPLDYYAYDLSVEDSQFAGRADNSVKYIGAFGGFSFEALYSFGYDTTIANGGQVPGEFRVGKEVSVGGGYARGPLNVVFAYDVRNGTSVGTQSNKDQHMFGAASYKIGKYKAFVGYRWLNSSQPLTTSTQARVDEYWAGLQYQLSTPLLISGAAYWSDIKSAGQHPLYLAANANYSLSVRTHLYAEVGYVKNSHGSNLGLNGFDANIVAGHNQTGMILGIVHYF